MVFRLIAATILVMVGSTRDGVRVYIYLRQRPRRLPVEILRESLENLRNTADDVLATTPMAFLALACFGGTGLFIFAPDKMAWGSVALPNWARWVGAGVALFGALGAMWALLYLGRQYSGLLRVRRDHVLIKQGPYAWVRHPMYSFGMPFLLGLGLLAANWFIVLTGIGASHIGNAPADASRRGAYAQGIWPFLQDLHAAHWTLLPTPASGLSRLHLAWLLKGTRTNKRCNAAEACLAKEPGP